MSAQIEHGDETDEAAEGFGEFVVAGRDAAVAFDPAENVLARLSRITTGARQTLTAWLGDVLACGESRHRGRVVTYASVAGLEPGTLRNAKMVGSRIPLSRRHDALSWTHHCEVGLAFAELGEIERRLVLAETEKFSTAALRQRTRAHLASQCRTEAVTGACFPAVPRFSGQ